MVNLNPSVNNSTHSRFFSWNQFRNFTSSQRLKEISFMAATALSVLGAAYLTVNDKSIFLSVFVNISMSFILLPQLLKYGNSRVFKNALVIHLLTMGSCFLGWALGNCGQASVSLLKIILNKTPPLAINLFFLTILGLAITSCGGYLVPCGQSVLEKAKKLAFGSKFEERYSFLKKHFKKIDKNFSNSLLTRSFTIYCASVSPNWLVLLLHKAFSRNVLTHGAFASLLPTYLSFKENFSLEQFNQLMNHFEEISVIKSKQHLILHDEVQKSLILSLQFAIDSLPKKDRPLAIATLLSFGPKLMPNLLSSDNFLSFFNGESLNTVNDSIKKLIQLFNQWDQLKNRYHKLFDQVTELEQEIQKIDVSKQSPAEQKKLKLGIEHINEAYSKLRVEIESLNQQKNVWFRYAPFWNEKTPLPFTQSPDLIKFLQSPGIWNQIDDVFNSLIKENPKNPTFIDHLQCIKSKLNPIINKNEKEDDDDFSACIFLATHGGFKASDYDVLQGFLTLSSKDKIDETLKEMGLTKEDDFYAKGICSKKGGAKPQVMQNLQNYIKKHSKPKSVVAMNFDKDSILTGLGNLSNKINRALFNLIQSGLILIPVFLSPSSAAAGFVLGTGFFVLQRFGFSGTKWVSDKIKYMQNSQSSLKILYNFFNQRYVFTLTNHRIQMSQRFLDTDVYGKMRLINLYTIISVVNTLFPALNFFQGITLADEVVNKLF